MENILLSNAVAEIIGKTVRVIKKDSMDDTCQIEEKLRWHVGEEFVVRKIVIEPWGCFLEDVDGHSLSLSRAEVIKDSIKKW